MQYPGYYNYYNVPWQYQSFYPDGGDYWYRYGDGAIYQVNPSNGLITGIAALLTGDPFAVGQPLPLGYSTYNVPFAYRDKSFVNALQWAIGLELFLLVEDPWRIFLTTDHPNGAPFTTYPHLIRLLMDKAFRDEQFAKLPKAARKHSILAELNRQGRLKVVDSFDLAEAKTKSLVAKLSEMGVQRPLIVTENGTDALYLAARNLPYVQVRDVQGLDPVALVGAENVVMTAEAVKKVEEWLA